MSRNCGVAGGPLQDLVVNPLDSELADASVEVELGSLLEIGLIGQAKVADDVRSGRPGEVDPLGEFLDPDAG